MKSIWTLLVVFSLSNAARANTFDRAAEFSRTNGGIAFAAFDSNNMIYSDGDANEPNRLYSGSKSFACLIAAAMNDDADIEFDFNERECENFQAAHNGKFYP